MQVSCGFTSIPVSYQAVILPNPMQLDVDQIRKR